MVKLIEENGKKNFACSICKLVYKGMKTAKSCEDFCRKHKSCSLEITKNAIGRFNKGKIEYFS